MMGGYLSTRWNWERTRQTTGGLLKLDARHMKRTGVFQRGALATWQWTRDDGEPIGTIQTYCDDDTLILKYATRRPGDTQWTPVRERVLLDTTPCHFGGERVWFRCPSCRSRRAMLFSAGGRFRCRACHDLAYPSTREDETERANRRIVALQRKLKAPPGCDLFHIPGKPPRMHWRTYERLVSELRTEHRRRDALWGAACLAILRRGDRLLSRPVYANYVPD